MGHITAHQTKDAARSKRHASTRFIRKSLRVNDKITAGRFTGHKTQESLFDIELIDKTAGKQVERDRTLRWVGTGKRRSI